VVCGGSDPQELTQFTRKEKFAQVCSPELSRTAELMNAGQQVRRLLVASNGITSKPEHRKKSSIVAIDLKQ
jgi:F0F1-type ATP synthase alpha subunit